jgi:hypothetical protein
MTTEPGQTTTKRISPFGMTEADWRDGRKLQLLVGALTRLQTDVRWLAFELTGDVPEEPCLRPIRIARDTAITKLRETDAVIEDFVNAILGGIALGNIGTRG